jgi:glycosyltransferase involved in cell wall biosynthesis
MNILAMCITWNRPKLLGRSIHCFLQQTHPDCKLLVLDDAGQYTNEEHENWSLISVKERYPSMGAKRNAVLELAKERYPEIEGFMLWDDDDVYFPHTMASVSKALEEKCWAQPRLVLEMTEDQKGLKRCESFNKKEQIDASLSYGGCWAWRLDTFAGLGNFSDTNYSEDMKVSRPCFKKHGRSADSTKDGNPWYYYNRLNNSISAEGKQFYTMRGEQEIQTIDQIPIGWNGPDIFSLPLESGIHPRPW